MPPFGRAPRTPEPPPSPSPDASAHPAGHIRLGVESVTRKPFDIAVPEGMAQHVTLLGLTGSGKTTTA